MSGFAFLHRSIIGHPAFRNDSEAMAFAYLVLKASWKPSQVRYKGRVIELARGQLSMSVRDFSAAMDRDKGWTERLFARLKSATMIETDNKTGVNVITICNYDKYQAIDDAAKTVAKTANGTGPRHRTIREEIKEPLLCVSRARTRKPDPEPDTHSEEIMIPEWIPSPQWAAFMAMRDRKRSPVTAYAAAQLFEAMEAIGAAGWDLAKVLDKTIRMGWPDVRMPIVGQDDELRRVSDYAHAGKWQDPAQRAAYLERIRSLPFAGTDGQPEQPPRTDTPRPPRSFGQHAAEIARAIH